MHQTLVIFHPRYTATLVCKTGIAGHENSDANRTGESFETCSLHATLHNVKPHEIQTLKTRKLQNIRFTVLFCRERLMGNWAQN